MIPLIIEGKKDLVVQRRLGFNGQIICVKNSSNILVDTLGEVLCDEDIIFVVFDDRGVSLSKDITQYLECRGVKVNSLLEKNSFHCSKESY